MDFRSHFNGHGDKPGQGLVDIVPLFEGCSLFVPNPERPPLDTELPVGIAEVLQKWMHAHPVRVRETLPVIKGGNMVGLFVWWDRVG